MFVAGASGWLGRRIVIELSRLGVRVVAGSRCGKGVEGANSQVRLQLESDLDSNTRLSLHGVSVVIHCAAHVHRAVETPSERQVFWEVNRGGTRRLVDLASQIGARRFIYLSSIAFYDWAYGGEVSEGAHLGPNSAYAASKLAGEQLCVESGLDYRVVRLGTVFGDGDRANFSKLAGALARRRFLLPGAGEARKSVLPLPLAARLIADLALRDEVPHRIMNLALPEAPTLREICGAFSSHCGFPRPLSVPLGLLRPAARMGDWVARGWPDFPLTSVNLRKLTTSTVVNTRRMQETWPNEDWGDFARWLAPCAEYYRSVARGSA